MDNSTCRVDAAVAGCFRSFLLGQSIRKECTGFLWPPVGRQEGGVCRLERMKRFVALALVV